VNILRFDDEHSYDQRIYDVTTIQEHLIPEQIFKNFIFKMAHKHGSITGMYWLVDVVCALNSKEFDDKRKAALKTIILKVYTYYDDKEIPPKQMVTVMKATGRYTMQEIADALNISRQTVYYYLHQQEELPTKCMLTYGEYNIMLDFMDCWHEIVEMEKL
jgi:predicted DNA-binding protein YlxM (UPF0122 family)